MNRLDGTQRDRAQLSVLGGVLDQKRDTNETYEAEKFGIQGLKDSGENYTDPDQEKIFRMLAQSLHFGD